MKKLFLLLVILFTFHGFACSCDITQPVKQAFDNSKEVFIGKIISIDSTHLSDYGWKIYLYDIKVLHFFKKDEHDRSKEIRTFFFRNIPGLCDSGFIPGENYLIYEANGERNYEKIMNFASKCSRTNLLSRVKKEELNELEKLSKTSIKDNPNMNSTSEVINKNYSNATALISQAETTSQYNNYLILISTLLFIIAVIFIFLYFKTKKKLRSVNKS